MTDRQQRIQTLYEISLSIGSKGTLVDTADDALLGYLQKLNCSVGAIYRHRSSAERADYETIATIPAVPESNNTLQAAFGALPDANRPIGEQLPISGQTEEGAHFCLFELPDFGVLAIGKHGGRVDEITRSALRPLNEKLAEACRSKLIETQQRVERNRFEAVFDAIPEPIVSTVVDDDGIERVKHINTPFEKTFGYSAEAARGRPIGALITPVVTGSSHTQITADRSDESETFATADGTAEFLSRQVAVNGCESKEYIHLYVDISEQKQHQHELERYERLVENLPIGVYRTTPGPDGEFRLVNKGLVDILEAETASDFETMAVSDSYIGATKRSQFSELLLEQGSVDGIELELQTLKGNPIWAAVTGRAVQENGETVFELALQDVTERKERQQQLTVLNRVLRHNLRNAMNVIKGNTRLLGEAVDASFEPHIAAIEQRVDSLEQLSNKAGTMRSLFDQGREVTTSVEMSGLLAELKAEFESSYPEATISIETADPVSVQADVRLKMALDELLDNAVVHNDNPQPAVTVSVSGSTVKPPSRWVDIMVSDNGTGIPTEEWQTLENGEETPLQHGTGLGLWLVYWTVSLLGGTIERSIVDSGSQVVLTLPRAPTAHSAD